MRLPRIFVVAAAFCLPVALTAEVSFNRDIRPILSDKCFRCHGPDANAREADLRLDLEGWAKQDLGGYAAIVPGDPDKSELIWRITEEFEEEVMPPPEVHKPVTAREVELLTQWIKDGASYDVHWSFKPVEKPEIPEVANAAWCRNEIDYFILSKLDEVGLQPSPEAEFSTLQRRMSLDLTGLPVGNFPEARGKDLDQLIDFLIQTQDYGEHMAYSWLDAARYADSDGYESDPMRTMWPWRDWVVETFNQHMPYDQFIIEQLAGDLLPDANLRQVLATGFNRNHRLNNEGAIDPDEWLIEYVADRAETTATVFMGLTLQCARCHDHKYDPISQKDYYQLFAYFHQMPEKGSARGASSAPPMIDVPALPKLEEFEKVSRQLEPYQARLDAAEKSPAFIAAYDAWIASLVADPELRKDLPGNLGKKVVVNWTEDQKEEARVIFLRKHYEPVADLLAQMEPIEKKLNRLKKSGAKVMVMGDMAEHRKTYILERGVFDQPRDEVSADTPDFLPQISEDYPQNRLGLAQWIVDPKHPLTARVAVNRVWAALFGVGMVETPEDFGAQGKLPTHPELLDYLAWWFVNNDWNLQALQKFILSSATYRQSSATSKEHLEKDPQNKWLARAPRFRLPAPVIRDQALAASGLLVERLGGPPVKPYQPEGLWKEVIKGGEVYERDTGEKLYRRSLYSIWRRGVKPPLMMILDANGRDTCSVSLNRTNTPLQALLLLNDTTFVEAARALAVRMLTEGGNSPADRIRFAAEVLLNRAPTKGEVKILVEELDAQSAHFSKDPESAENYLKVGEYCPPQEYEPVELAAYTSVARVLLNLDETLTRE